MIEFALVGIGGAIGAISRYGVGRTIGNTTFPWSVFVVNVLGSTLLGFLLFGPIPHELVLLFGVGFCGAFTTFSTFSYQTVMLAEKQSWRRAGIHACGTLVVALIGFLIGASLGGALG